jgi:hypothetical protein
LINGCLGLIKNLIQLIGVNIEEFLSSPRITQQPLNTSKNIDANEQHLPINVRQIIEVKKRNYFFSLNDNIFLVFSVLI